MKKIKDLTEKRAALVAESEAIVAKLDSDTPLADADQTRFDAIGVELEAIDKNLKTLTENEARKSHKTPGLELVGEDPPEPPPESRRKTIPAQAKRHIGKLRSFKGPNAEEKAYRAGRFLMATAFKDADSVQWCREHGIDIRGDMSSTTNSAGGALVYPEFAATLIDLVEEYGVFRSNCEVVPMNSDTLTWARTTAGMTAYFVAESTAPTESNPTFDNIQLVAKKLATLTEVPNELMADAAIAIADIVSRKIALAMATKEDQCGFIGDGTSTYGGIQGFAGSNSVLGSASIYTAPASSLAFVDFTLGDFESVVGKFPLYAGARPKWYISAPGFYASMARLADAAGGNTKGDINAGFALQFMGFPVVLTQVMPTSLADAASTIQCLLADLTLGATLGDRQMITVDSDQGGTYFQKYQTGIRGIERFDIVCHGAGDSTNAGPVIALKTPAS